MRPLPRAVRATIRTRRLPRSRPGSPNPSESRSTAILIEPGGQIDDWADRIDRQWPFMQQHQHAEIRVAEPGLFDTGGCITRQGAHRLDHHKPYMIRLSWSIKP